MAEGQKVRYTCGGVGGEFTASGRTTVGAYEKEDW